MKKLREMSVEILVGAFMFAVLGALAFFTIILSYENIFKEYYALEVKFEHVQGLREGDNVFVRGVMIGRVKTLTVEPDGVVVSTILEQPVTMRQGYEVEIVPSSVLGGQYVSLEEGPLDAPPLPAGTVLRGQTPADLLGEATDTIGALRRSLEEGDVLRNLEETMAQINTITKNLEAGTGTLGKLLTDEELYENLRQVSARLNEGKGLLGKLLSEDETMYEDLSETMANLRRVTDQIESGEGTLGKLVADEGLYEEAQLLLSEIRAAVDDFRETAPITTFTSIFFGAF
jgi:phospholipid/cholesterol/gamma-HCH transport system substrate-binding protein